MADMTAEEIVKSLRELLPPKIDYAELVGAEGFSYGQHYVWEDPEPYMIESAANLIETLQAENSALRAKVRELGSEKLQREENKALTLEELKLMEGMV